MKLIYTAISKHYFYFRMHISKFVVENKNIPLNLFMIYEYFLIDSVEREDIINGNNEMVKRADEIWVFGPVSDGVLEEIILAKEMKKPIRYFKIIKSKEIQEIQKEEVEFEEDLNKFKEELY